MILVCFGLIYDNNNINLDQISLVYRQRCKTIRPFQFFHICLSPTPTNLDVYSYNYMSNWDQLNLKYHNPGLKLWTCFIALPFPITPGVPDVISAAPSRAACGQMCVFEDRPTPSHPSRACAANVRFRESADPLSP
eukprot:923541_1